MLGLSPHFSLQMSFIISLGAAMGSLFFSEVLHYPPCVLCWYQRIFMFPLVLIFGIALWTEDRGYSKYSVALATIGLLISIYHNLLYYGVISQGIIPCAEGVSCSAKQVELFGFVTIPLMSFGSFFVLVMVGFFSLLSRSNADEK